MNDLDTVSEDVRKAFRLLMVFTKTFKSVVKFIETKLAITYSDDSQLFRTPPQNKSRNLDNKAYVEWFPLYYHVFNFSKSGQGSFSIILQCDTGYWDYYSADKNADNFYPKLSAEEIKDDVEKYADVTAAKTKIIFAAANKADVDIGYIFENSCGDDDETAQNWHMRTKDSTKNFSLPVSDRSGKKAFFRVYELSDFKDEETTTKTLNDFVGYLTKNGITDFQIAQ